MRALMRSACIRRRTGRRRAQRCTIGLVRTLLRVPAAQCGEVRLRCWLAWPLGLARGICSLRGGLASKVVPGKPPRFASSACDADVAEGCCTLCTTTRCLAVTQEATDTTPATGLRRRAIYCDEKSQLAERRSPDLE